MDFDVITTSVKKAFDTFVQNIVAYIVGFLIAIIGSIFIITIAPLFYGLYYMAIKGTRGEKVEIKDILYGFSSLGTFIRSWIGFIVYGILVYIISIIINVIVVLGISIAPSVMGVLSIVSMIITFIIEILLFFTLYIYVMTPSESIIYAIKESFGISKSNIIMVILTMIVSFILSILIVTIPLGMVFAAYVLKELKPGIKDASGI